MATLSILVRVCICVLGFYPWAFKALMGSLEYCSTKKAKIVCFSLCLFDVIVALYAMHEIMLNEFLIGK